MKKIISILIFTILTIPVALVAEKSPATEIQKTQTITMEVHGMTCSSCVNHLSETMKENQAVEDIDVNLETKEVKVKLKSEVSEEALEQLVKKAGYNVIKFIR